MSLVKDTSKDGMEFITSSTVSNVASVTFDNSVLDGRFKNYFLKINQLQPATDDQRLFATLSNDNGSSFHVTNYSSSLQSWDTVQVGTDVTIEIPLAGASATHGISNSANDFYCTDLFLFDPTNSASYTYFTNRGSYTNAAGDGTITSNGGAYVGAAESHDAIKIEMTSGNIVTATFTWYGVNGE